jgi:hypothetical protein
MNRFPFVYCLIFLLIIGCSENQINYTIGQEKIDSKKCSVKAAISLLPEKDEITLKFKIKNKTSGELRINYYGANLSIDSITSAIPESNKEYKTLLKPGETERYELRYHPVNSPSMFQKTGYRGDLKKQYSLNFGFITDNDGNKVIAGSIFFKMPDTVYGDYQKTYGKNKDYQLFELEPDTTKLISEQINHLKEHLVYEKPDQSEGTEQAEPVVLFNDSEIILDNRVITISGYRKSDTLYLNSGVINMGKDKLKAQLNKLYVLVEGKKFFPLSVTSEFFAYNSPVDSAYLLKQDARFIFQAKYCIADKFQKFTVDKNWLQIQSTATKQTDFVPLLVRDFQFIASQQEN